MIRLFVEPECERRRLEGSLTEPLVLNSFQVCWSGEGGNSAVVRLNGETRILLKLDVPQREGLHVGKYVAIDSTTKVEALHPYPEEEKYAHFSAVLLDGKWFYSFDFRYQRVEAREHLRVAEEFYQTAVQARRAGRVRSFLENAHSAAELFVKIDLLLVRQVSSGRVQHATVRKAAARFLNLEIAHSLLERLSELRLPSRYLVGELRVNPDELENIASALEALMIEARRKTAANGPSV